MKRRVKIRVNNNNFQFEAIIMHQAVCKTDGNIGEPQYDEELAYKIANEHMKNNKSVKHLTNVEHYNSNK